MATSKKTSAKKTSNKKAVAKVEDTGFLDAAIGEEQSGAFGDMDASTMAIPYLKLVQKTAAEMKKSDPKYMPEAEEGQYVNSVTRKLYDNPIVMVLGFEHIYTEWTPDGKLVARHAKSLFSSICVNPKDFPKYMTAAGNDLTETYMYYLLVEGEEADGPVILSLTKSNITSGQAWNRLLQGLTYKGKKLSPEYGKYELSTADKSNKQGEWKVLKATRIAGNELVSQEQFAAVNQEKAALPDAEKVSHSMQIAEGKGTSQATGDEAEEDVKY